MWYLLIGLVAGWLASLVVKGNGSGLVMNLVLGVIGGLQGGWILSWFGVLAVGTFGSLVAALVGAVVLLWIAAAINKRKHNTQNVNHE